MRSLHFLRLGLLAWILASALPCRAQGLSDPSGLFPPKPENHVRDHAGLYIRDQESLSKISERLQRLAVKHGYHIYVVIESALMNEPPVELAARLQSQWLPNGDGLVVVYQSDSRTFGVAPPEDLRMLETDSRTARIPSYAIVEILDRVSVKLGKPADDVQPEVLLDELTTLLVTECEAFFDQMPKEGADRSAPELLLWCSVAIAVLGGAGWLLVRKLRKVDERNSRTFYFPEREDAQRLGAPFGAKVISRRFSGEPGDPS